MSEENDFDIYDEIVEKVQYTTCMPNIGNDMILKVEIFDNGGDNDMATSINNFLESGSEDEIDIKLVVDIQPTDSGVIVIYYEPID